MGQISVGGGNWSTITFGDGFVVHMDLARCHKVLADRTQCKNARPSAWEDTCASCVAETARVYNARLAATTLGEATESARYPIACACSGCWVSTCRICCCRHQASQDGALRHAASVVAGLIRDAAAKMAPDKEKDQ